ncbi:MAG: O-methyltransferase [Gemmatimonadetes bacterium]|uniref:O-methyltransferase n=1 Tax=Candidatus Kutchimonas denitrificans TaxID=3056748 RepID=A0AAE4Z917_9BACT|nr:O-methyltransferase [Gemmatimonadota bacterium]NIR74722.1 O-methyltransferase [Candidatus Kutchimonas denitrificans]NIS01472.1 O-methyltransferase [Gemmatimonadota bacterium]NIT67213.1 O-methyltransferase [Gemmatimonadota bacterium]NIU52387.1 methyltransferase domain-containing protein [Gemmatimonadota bacterium]
MDAVQRKECGRYVAELFAPEDEVLAELRREISAQDMPEIYVDREEGRLLQVLLQAVGARRVIELGTLGGYSAIWMARALAPDGQLITIEREAERAEVARRFLDRAGLSDRVEVRVGEALELLPDLANEGPFDAIFIDADKKSYPVYLDWALANLREGGLVIGDNAFKGGAVLDTNTDDPGTRGIQEFNRRLAGDPRLTSVIVPTRDGVAIAVVKRS